MIYTYQYKVRAGTWKRGGEVTPPRTEDLVLLHAKIVERSERSPYADTQYRILDENDAVVWETGEREKNKKLPSLVSLAARPTRSVRYRSARR